MNEKQRNALVEILGEDIQFDRAMSEYTTFGIGGHAEALCFVQGSGELQSLISCLNDESIPYIVMGKGSNLLVRDRGFQGVVIILRGELAALETDPKNHQILVAGGGLNITELLSYCTGQGLGGLEFLAGIPGTIGGAVAMNAGAFGKDMAGVVQDIELLTPQGEWATRKRSQLNFSYRSLSLPKGTLVVKATFNLDRETPETVRRRVVEHLKRRKETQPLEYPSAGSVFKNPPNDYAGRLIEGVGLKGTSIGGAMISPKHANYIVNTGGAKAADVLALMEMAQQKVREAAGVELEPEIRVVGVDEP